MSPVKLCKDCKWAQRSGWPFKKVESFAKCVNPSIIRYQGPPNLVTGQEPPMREYCSTARLDISTAPCGPEGRLWESAK